MTRVRSVHYLWFVTEHGWVQVYQITNRNRDEVVAFLRRGLEKFEKEKTGAAFLEVTLDPDEREIIAEVEVTYNRRTSAKLRQHLERQLSRYRVPRRFLPPAPPPLRRRKKRKEP